MTLYDDISYLKGVGPARAKVLASETGIRTYADLLDYLPFRYVDRSVISTIASVREDDPFVVVKGTLSNMQTVALGPRRERLTVDLFDGTGYFQLVWFAGTKWIRERLKSNVEYLVMGKPSIFNNVWQITHPDIEPFSAVDDGARHPLMPVYHTTDKMKQNGLGTRALARITETLVQAILHSDSQTIPENLPDDILRHFRLLPRCEAMTAIHYPDNRQQLDQARLRLKFEELFFLQLDYQYAHQQRVSRSQGRIFAHVGDHFNSFYKQLPFPLTGAQKRVIREIREDMRTGRQMNRLVQGDVGSGKTLVALMCMLLAVDNGAQACLMAPTEILASQHFLTFQRLLDGLGLNVQLLTGSLRPAAKKKIKQQLADGQIDLLIGTHALIEDNVAFRNLGLVVIDEQHRFGVEQRSKLWNKSEIPPHILVMTATPIPRTLAMTLYGDLDCSVIDELPPGRHPVRTYHRLERNRPLVFSFLKKQIDEGRQVYIVYPLIEESEKMDLKNLQDGLEMVQSYFPRPQYQTSMVHGRLTAEEKAFEMDRFKRGLTHIMVATTVIEVGVDVPNASVMVIENAERFGLSQLHQLRGRVGRGADQAYCILMTKDDLSYTSQERIRTMCATTDGFQIAEADLRLRGPGDIQGLQQSGALDLRLASIVDDEPLVAATRDTVRDLLSADPTLSRYPLLQQHIAHSKNKMLWGKIS
ncbi:MAG: ATP-dependent DNA helicase RecG [Bacteroidales bacterium]|nr:ATP-dependent DNA helicase RecG [Bacteroidales bacterium]